MDHPPRESVLGRKVMSVRDLESKVSKSLTLKRASPHKYCGEAAATTLKFESRDD